MAAHDPATRFVFVPDAVIGHRVSAARMSPSYVFRRCFSDGRTKTVLSRRTGVAALGPERRYLTRTVPLGVLRSMASGRWRAALVLIGAVLYAAGGFLAGRRSGPVADPVAGRSYARG
jgi:hypothetical protein